MPDIFISPEKDAMEPSLPEKTAEPVLPVKEPQTEADRRALSGHSHKALSAFSFYPDHIDFETRSKEEKIVLLLRQHPVINVKWILVTILMIFVPGLVRSFGVLSTLPVGFELIIAMAWYLFTMAYALENFLSWYFNVYFVTDERVIDVDFYNLIDKRVSEAGINKIQDVSYTTAGVLGTMLDFGNVLIQTAAEVSEFEFESVPNPEKVTKILNDLKENLAKEDV